MGSIRVRLLAVAVVVAIVAVGATAVIAQRIASDDLRNAVERDLELEQEVARAVEDHALFTGSWEDLDVTVAEISELFGERVAVTDEFGRILADSEPGEPIPAQPIALLAPNVVDLGLLEQELFEEAIEECELSEDSVEFEECMFDNVDDDVELVLSPVLVYLGDESRTTASVLGDEGLDGRLVAVGLAVVVGAVGLAAASALPLLSPISRLRRAAARLGAGELDTRVPEQGATELADLARSFNSMADSLERDDAQRRQWTSDVAHELRSPLQNLRGQLESGQDGLMDVDDRWFDSLVDEVGHLTHLVEDLQTLTLADSDRLALDRRPIDLGELVADVLRSFAARASEAGVELRTEGNAVAEVDERRIRQVLGNLIDNALRHTASGGSIDIDLLARPDDVMMVVKDTGEGVPPEVLDVVLDRFRRADAARSRTTGGSGLGLAIVQSLVEAHGGEVGLESELGLGTTVAVRLPVDGHDPSGPGAA
ncbi:MAG: ATP-binding protein [Actinomycetota bacterium]